MKAKRVGGSLVQRVRLLGPSARGGSVVAFEAPVYFLRSGLALHPAWSVFGLDSLGPQFIISAIPCGWRVASFGSLERAEAAFLDLEALSVQWHRMGPRGTARYSLEVQRQVVAVLVRHGASYQERSRRGRAAEVSRHGW